MKKVLTVVLVIAMVFAMAIPVVASSNSQIVTGADTRIWQDGFGFHCNVPKGNGATAVEYLGENSAVINSISKIKKQPAGSLVVEKGDQKDIFGTKTYPIALERVGSTTTWNLLTDDIECKTCGRIDWVTYSNNSGVINGKNIQVNHSTTPKFTPPPEEPPTFSSTVSFNKVKYGGLLPVGADEFAFDLYNVDTGALIGTYETDFSGTVTVGNLAPGSYVFKEVVSLIKTQELWGTGGHGYDHTWKAVYPGGADGLYFTVAADGKVTWRDSGDENPTVNNIINCKHALQWTTAEALGTTDWYMESQGHTPFNGGWLLKGNCGAYGYTVEEARCGRDLVINLWCEVSQTGMIIYAPGTALDHKYIATDEQAAGCANWGVTTIWCTLCGDVDYIYHTEPTGHNYQVVEGFWRVLMCTNWCGSYIDDPDWCEDPCFSSPCACQPIADDNLDNED